MNVLICRSCIACPARRVRKDSLSVVPWFAEENMVCLNRTACDLVVDAVNAASQERRIDDLLVAYYL